jgi:hypothetical protein
MLNRYANFFHGQTTPHHPKASIQPSATEYQAISPSRQVDAAKLLTTTFHHHPFFAATGWKPSFAMDSVHD